MADQTLAPESSARSNLAFLAGDGEMAKRIRGYDWASTPLGVPESWPAPLRTTVRMALSTGHPVLIMWGPELICIYNDAFRASLGSDKHPCILGSSGRKAWAETWPIIGADLERVLAGGAPTWQENQLVPIERNGQLEDVYWTYSYAGIEDDASPNGTGGVLVLVAETTAHVRAVERATSELQKLGRLFQDAPVFIAVVAGRDYRFELANPAYERMVGREVIGRTVAEAFPEVIEQGYVQILDSVYNSGQPYIAQGAKIEFTQADGRLDERRIDFVYQPTRDSDGAVDGIFVVGVDVTERASAEQALGVSEEQLRLATEAGDVGLWDVDPVAGKLYWPARVRHMFGIFSDRPVTMEEDFAKGVHPDDRAQVLPAFANAVDPAMRATYDVEYRTVGQEDGLIRWVAAKGRGIFDESGRCIRVIGTAVDVTARKRDEARLMELNDTLERRLEEHLAERKLLSDIVEEADPFIQVADFNFRWLAINRSSADEFERIYHVRPKVGMSMLDALASKPEEQARVRAVWQEALDSEGFTRVEEFGSEGLARRAYEMHFRPYHDHNGKRIGAYQFVYDVTERLQSQLRLAKAESALRQAQKMEAVGQLTGGIAHDFNNLLQAVSTKFELIRRFSADPARVSEWASSGTDVTKRGARLASQLLTFSRQQEPDVRPVSLKLLLEGMKDLLVTTVGPTVRVALACDDQWVMADSTQLEMSLINLAANARDAMPSGGDFVVSCRLAGSEKVEIRVSDTGAGMAPEVLAKAFEPFFTTKGVGRGSGLGLSQVYGMAQRVGGEVRIESDGHSGTTIVLKLKRAMALTTDETAASDNTESSTVEENLLVLLVDDDPHVREGVAETVKSLGHRVLEAQDGEAGLKELNNHPVNLVLVDFAMPVMDGAAFAKLARVARPDLPLVFISGYSDADAIQEAVGQSALLLRKPFDLATLRQAMAKARGMAPSAIGQS